MKQCEFCGANLPEGAGFCGICGRVSHQASEQVTHLGDIPTINMEQHPNEGDLTMPIDGETFISPRNNPLTPFPSPSGYETVMEEEEDDEEKRRRAALLLGVPLLAGQQAPAQVPTIQGTPSAPQVPTIQGTPTGTGSPSLPGQAATHQPQPTGHQTFHHPHHHHHHGHTGKLGKPGHPAKPGKPATGPSGCLTVSLVLVAAAIILVSIFAALSLTVWSPSLALSGASTVAPGGTLTLQGSHFLPNSTVTLTLDNGVPLLFSQAAAPTTRQTHQRSDIQERSLQGIALTSSILRSPLNTNVVTVGGDGSFTITVAVSSTWSDGQHTVHATESLSHRSASLNFTIGQPATATATATSTTTLTPTPTLTPTSTSTPPSLICASPNQLNLGPLSELSSQIATNTVTLCTSGTGTLTWKASWDRNQAPWLQIPVSSGTAQAPNEIAVTVAASAARLAAGTYTATITFTGQESNTTQTVHVSLKVQQGCVNEKPPRMVFTGVQGGNSPGPQNISITNCGLVSDWSAKTASNSSWLNISPSQGTLKSNGSATITVAVSLSGLKASNTPYQDTVVISLGGQTINVSVLLVVQPLPTLSVNPTMIDPNNSSGNQACHIDPTGTGADECDVTLINNSSSAPLTWSWSSGTKGVTVQPSSGTIPPGSSVTVTIVFSRGLCTTVDITFTGPANSVTVTWSCQIIG